MFNGEHEWIWGIPLSVTKHAQAKMGHFSIQHPAISSHRHPQPFRTEKPGRLQKNILILDLELKCWPWVGSMGSMGGWETPSWEMETMLGIEKLYLTVTIEKLYRKV